MKISLKIIILLIQLNFHLETRRLIRFLKFTFAFLRYEEMDKTIREKELCVDKLRRMLDEQDKNKIFLEEQINEYKNQIKDLKCNLKETDSQKEKRIECLNEEIGKLKLDLNKHIEVKARHTVTSDLNLFELSRENELLKLSLNKLNNDLNDMKNKFNETLNQKAQLENENIKLSQEWQRRYENLERLKSSDSEAFVKQLMDSKNEVDIFNKTNAIIHSNLLLYLVLRFKLKSKLWRTNFYTKRTSSKHFNQRNQL